jgi:hypothetical protein
VGNGVPEGFRLIPKASLFWGLFMVPRLFGRVVVGCESENLGDEEETPDGSEYNMDVVAHVLWVSNKFSLCKGDME